MLDLRINHPFEIIMGCPGKSPEMAALTKRLNSPTGIKSFVARIKDTWQIWMEGRTREGVAVVARKTFGSCWAKHRRDEFSLNTTGSKIDVAFVEALTHEPKKELFSPFVSRKDSLKNWIQKKIE